MAARPPAARARGAEFAVGDRVTTGDRAGVVRFDGSVSFATGRYVGIELDQPEGKHDGSMKGERYFTCRPGHGVFVKPSLVTLVEETPAASAAPIAAASAPAPAAVAKPASRVSSRRPSMSVAEDGGLVSPVSASAPAPTPAAASAELSTPPRKSSIALDKALEARAALARDSPVLAASSVMSPPKATFALPPLAAVKSPESVAPIALSSTAPPANAGELARLQASFDTLQVAHSKLGGDREQLAASLAQAQAQASQASAEQSRLSQELSARERTLASLRTEISELQAAGTSLESLQSMVEMLTLDKALAEEQHESAQAELELVQNNFDHQELELQLLREQHAVLQHQQAAAQQAAVAAQHASGGGVLVTSENLSEHEAAGAANQKLLEQNALLTDALRKLRDLNLGEKQAATSRIGELERQNAQLAAADTENFALREAATKAQASIASLKEQLDEALELQTMVENLSQAKLDLEEREAAATRTATYLQSMVSAQEEVEEGYKELQAQLQSELEAAEFNFVDLNQRYKMKTTQIDDLQATNRKFRELVRQLEQENQALKARALEAPVDAGALVTSAPALSGLAATRSSSLLQRRLKQVRTAQLDRLLAVVERDLLEKRVQFLALYIPHNITTDDRSLAFLQMLERLKQKASVLAQVWAQFYGGGAAHQDHQEADLASGKVAVDYAANGTSPEMALLAYNACLLLASLVHGVENLTGALYPLDLEAYNALCIRSASELAPLENILDSYLNMVQLDTLNELTSLASLVRANFTLYAFLVEKVPITIREDAIAVDELNALPYEMALWTVVKRSAAAPGQGQEEQSKWIELATTYRSRSATAAASEASKRPLALLPSSVPSLGTFALTLSYSAALAHTYAQLVADQLNALVEALRRGRAAKRAEGEDARLKKERAEALGGLGSEEDITSPSNASLAEYTTPAEDADIGQYAALWSDVADAALNNLSLANQLHQTAVRNYANTVASSSSSASGTPASPSAQKDAAKQEASLRALLPHMHAIDTLSQSSLLQLATLLASLRPLLQAEQLVELSHGITAEPPVEEEAQAFHPVLKQVLALLRGARSSDADDSSPSLLGGLTQLRSQLFTTSKKVLGLIEDHAAASSAPADSPAHQANRAMHQRTASFVLTAPEAVNAPPPSGATDGAALANVLATMQPWFHHPLTIRAQLSASAALRTALQEQGTRLAEKQKDLLAAHKSVSEERAKHAVLAQQLAVHASRAGHHSEQANMNESLRAQLDESAKQLSALKAQVETLTRENRAARKQMLKLKTQYLKDEQARTQTAATGPSVAGSGAGGITNLASLSSANLAELVAEGDLLRKTLAAQREDLATWKTRQTMHELATMLPPLVVASPPPVRARNVCPPTPMAVHPPPHATTSAASLLQAKLLGSMRVNPLLAAMPPALPVISAFPAVASSIAAASGAQAQQEREQAEARFLRAKLGEVAQHVWAQRIAPRVVKMGPASSAAPESDEKKDEEKTPSPYQQYLEHRVHAAHVQQCCDKLGQRVNAMADQQRLRQWARVV